MTLNRTRVEQLLNQFAGRKIVIVGDVMLDEFIWGKVRRISPEAPVPVVEVLEETYRLGGSGNVAANIRALDGTPIPIGVLGRDVASDRVHNLLKQSGIDVSGLFHDDRPTTLKTRILAHSQQVVRTDRESRQALSSGVTADLAAAFERNLPQASAIVISDYDKGVINRELLAAILPKAKVAGVPVFLDPKVHHAEYYRPIGATKFGDEVIDESVQRRRKEERAYEPQNNGLPHSYQFTAKPSAVSVVSATKLPSY